MGRSGAMRGGYLPVIDMAIGIFDSGLGGLTVLDAAQKRLPSMQFIYLADNANAPYGVRKTEDIYNLTCVAVQKLFDLTNLNAFSIPLSHNTGPLIQTLSDPVIT